MRALRFRCWSLIIGLGCLLATGVVGDPAPAWPQETSDIPVSPRVTSGRLANGVRYALLPNPTPSREVCLRLIVAAGSFHERDDERGYAHFVEHMAFNGTRQFPAGALVKFLQSTGATFGPHVKRGDLGDAHALQAQPAQRVSGDRGRRVARAARFRRRRVV